jgi:uncharacterized protein
MLAPVELYDIHGKTLFARGKKYYLSDHSWRKYLLSGFDTGLARELETVVYWTGKRAGRDMYIGKIGDKEIDFVAEKAGKKLYIQVAYSLSEPSTFQREFGNLQAIPDNYPKWVISMDTTDWGQYEGIRHCPVWECEKVFGE